MTQAEMAKLMGFSFRGYQDLETGRASFAPRHLMLLERLSLRLAVALREPSLAMAGVREDLEQLAELTQFPGFSADTKGPQSDVHARPARGSMTLGVGPGRDAQPFATKAALEPRRPFP